MGHVEFLDFDLAVESFGDGYRARVLDSPAGQASHAFRFPVDDWELETFLVWLAGTHHRTRRVESREMRAAKQLGARLFQAVFADQVRSCWERALDESQRRDAGLRLRLHLSDAPELAELPWEFLYDPARNQFPALSAKTPLVRYFDLPHTSRPVTVKPPLRVLVMLSSPTDWDTLDVDRERANLKRALANLLQRGHVILDFLPEATLEALQQRLRQHTYQLFHFIGHGGFDADRRDGVLILRDENGRGRRITSQRLGAILTDHSSLRLVILNACEGARSAREDPFTGVAQTLVQRGIPAVIAMQYEVSDAVAITFSQEFYAALVDHYPVDAAIGEARKAVYGQGNDVAWGIPVLYMRAPDGKIFDFETRVEIRAPKRVVRATTYALGLLSVCAVLFLLLLAFNIFRLYTRFDETNLFQTGWLAAFVTVTPTDTPTRIPTQTAPRVLPSETLRARNTRPFTRTASPPPTATFTSTFLPTSTWTSTPRATRRPNTRAPTRTFTATIVPGVYLTTLRIAPENPLRNQQIYFVGTLLNTTGAPLSFRLRFQLYNPETRKRFTDTPIQDLILANGETSITDSWIYDSALTGCVLYYVQLEYQTNSARIPFRNLAGEIVARDFAVCAPER